LSYKKQILIGVKVAFSALCIYHLVQKFGHEFSTVNLSLKRLNFLFLALGVFLYAMSQILSVWRWQACCQSLGISQHLNAPSKATNRIYLLGLFWNNFLPGSFGGDLVRAYLLKKENRNLKWALCVGSVFIDRAFGVFALCWVGFLSALWVAKGQNAVAQKLIWFTGSLSLGSLVALIVFNYLSNFMSAPPDIEPEAEEEKSFLEKCQLKLAEFIGALKKIEADKPTLLKMLTASVLVQILVTLCLIALAIGLGLNIKLPLLWLVNPVVTLGSLLAPSVNGLGVREGIYAYLFKSFGYSGSDGIMLSVVWLFVLLLMSLPGAFLIVLKKKKTLSPAIELNTDVEKKLLEQVK
jgi:glycosyltransferase 2 family protein